MCVTLPFRRSEAWTPSSSSVINVSSALYSIAPATHDPTCLTNRRRRVRVVQRAFIPMIGRGEQQRAVDVAGKARGDNKRKNPRGRVCSQSCESHAYVHVVMLSLVHSVAVTSAASCHLRAQFGRRSPRGCNEGGDKRPQRKAEGANGAKHAGAQVVPCLLYPP